MKEEEKKTVPGSCDWIPGDRRNEGGGSCEWGETKKIPTQENRSTVYGHRADHTWESVEPERYKADDGGWSAIARHVLIGARGESVPFDLRYFEIAPGGYSSLEKHRHEHVVIVVRGRGEILLAGKVREIGRLDTAYIAPDDPHQLLNPHDEPFGFFCIVSHERDRPRRVDEEELRRLLGGRGGEKIRP